MLLKPITICFWEAVIYLKNCEQTAENCKQIFVQDLNCDFYIELQQPKSRKSFSTKTKIDAWNFGPKELFKVGELWEPEIY